MWRVKLTLLDGTVITSFGHSVQEAENKAKDTYSMLTSQNGSIILNREVKYLEKLS